MLVVRSVSRVAIARRTLSTATPGSSSSKIPQSPPSSDAYVKILNALAIVLGSKSKTSTAIRETRNPYELCAARDSEETNFLHNQCQLSRTYQTWFQVTNLHVWLLRARYRALPSAKAKPFAQEIVNHFFADVELRMRSTLSHKAPERIVKGYLTEMRDQFHGSTPALDLGLVGSDAELAGALWRNLFAARGLDGQGEVLAMPIKSSSKVVVTPVSSDPADALPSDASEGGEGPIPLPSATLAELPFHLYILTAYTRRELLRLASLPDEAIISGEVGSFGSMEAHVHAAQRDFLMEREERALLGLEGDVASNERAQRKKLVAAVA